MNRNDTGDVSDVALARSRREGGWDLRVAFVERRQSWWWNAWQAATGTELYGFTESRTAAWSAMSEAITTARPHCLAPGLMETIKPRGARNDGSTEEVPR